MQGDRQEKTSSGLPSLQANCNLLFVKLFFTTNLSDKTRVIHKKKKIGKRNSREGKVLKIHERKVWKEITRRRGRKKMECSFKER